MRFRWAKAPPLPSYRRSAATELRLRQEPNVCRSPCEKNESSGGATFILSLNKRHAAPTELVHFLRPFTTNMAHLRRVPEANLRAAQLANRSRECPRRVAAVDSGRGALAEER